MLTDRTDVTADRPPKSEDAQTPAGYLVVSLSEDDRLKLSGWLESHLRQIEQAMAPVLARFEQERNQLEGLMTGAGGDTAGPFRLNTPITKRKARQLANRIKQAYLDSDPVWAIQSNLDELSGYTEEFEKALDRAVDHELGLADDLAQWCFEAVLHGCGLIEPGWAYHEERVRRLERWEPFDGTTLESLDGLARFELDYPTWREEKDLRTLHSLLGRGTPVERELEYTQPTVNQPALRFVPCASARVYPDVEGFEGLRTTPAYGYLKTYTRFELEALEAAGTIDEGAVALLFSEQQDRDGEARDAREEQEGVDVWHATIRYRLEGDESPVRYKVWYAVKERVILRCRAWPWWYWEPDLLPLHVRDEEPGFWKRGLAWDVVDDHEASNVTLNLFLNAADMANALRLKVKQNSLAERYLLSGRYSPRLPVPYETNPQDVDTLNYPTAHLAPLLESHELMRRQADENTSTTILQSGRESPADPTAPASKAALLLQQAEPDLKEYFRAAENGFRQAGRWLVWLYHQGIGMGWIETMPGLPNVPNELLPRVAAALQPRATLFEFDRAGRQQINLMMLELIGKFFPHELGRAFKIVMKQTNSTWSREADTFEFQPPMPQAAPGAPVAPVPSPSAGPTLEPNGNGAPRPALAGMLG